jgi:hypothetical protein
MQFFELVRGNVGWRFANVTMNDLVSILVALTRSDHNLLSLGSQVVLELFQRSISMRDLVLLLAPHLGVPT